MAPSEIHDDKTTNNFDAEILASWHRNARNWLEARQANSIPGRHSGKDTAILNAIAAHRPATLLDIGCGDGWLLRAVRDTGDCVTVGLDGAPALIESAKSQDPQGCYQVADYRDLCDGIWPECCPSKEFDAVIFNFSLFTQDIRPILSAAKTRLAQGGIILIQSLTVEHLPARSKTAGEGWQLETFNGFGDGNWAPMPWYCRSMSSWISALQDVGLQARQIIRVGRPDPLSILILAKSIEDISLFPRAVAPQDNPISGDAENSGSNL
ncbi:MAG: class I SAM-dependent methyltransferase [Alphaproteobacteria bacterium]|nr:class I SAM-dependent methyltransferase [Alphaproteobacteria bacterium]